MKTELYYTGAKEFNVEQTDPQISIGGYISITRLMLNGINNLFSAESYKSIAGQKEQHRCIAMKATGNLYDVVLKVSVEDEANKNFTLELGVNTPSLNNAFEALADDKIAPSYTDFESIKDGVNDREFQLGDITLDSYLGIWIKRKFNDVYNDIESLTNKLCENSANVKVHNKDEYSLIKFEIIYKIQVNLLNQNGGDVVIVEDLSTVQFPCDVTGFSGNDLGDANTLEEIADKWNSDVDSNNVGTLSLNTGNTAFVMDFSSSETYNAFENIAVDFTPV